MKITIDPENIEELMTDEFLLINKIFTGNIRNLFKQADVDISHINDLSDEEIDKVNAFLDRIGNALCRIVARFKSD